MAGRRPVRTASVAVALTAALLLAGCGSTSDSSGDASSGATTTVATGAGGSDGGGSTGSTGSSGGGDTASSSNKGPDCKTTFKAAAEKALGQASFKVTDLGGACTVFFGTQDASTQVSHLWNWGAATPDSWDGMVNMLDAKLAKVPGLGDDARGGVDNGAARLDVWVKDQGAHQLTMLPAYPAEASQKEVDALQAVAKELLAG